MQKKLLTNLLILAIVCIQPSFATVSTEIFDRGVDSKNGKESKTECFIQKKDGTIQNFKSLKLVTGFFKTPHLLADGKIKIEAKDIASYQNSDHYAISDEQIEGERKSKVATSTLPGFAVRVAKGKLNVYSRKYYNGKNAVDELFIQIGNDEKIVPYTPELMVAILKNHPSSLNVFNSKKHLGTLTQKLQAVAGIYNQDQLMSKN
ncbi:MAG: hypothetical protein WEA59_07290 [Ferruginibacter sp.]